MRQDDKNQDLVSPFPLLMFAAGPPLLGLVLLGMLRLTGPFGVAGAFAAPALIRLLQEMLSGNKKHIYTWLGIAALVMSVRKINKQ
jgi:hypothetical protein